MKKLVVQGNQTPYDIALQEYGSAEGIFLLMKDNPGKITSIDCGVEAGTILRIDSPVIDEQVKTYYDRYGVNPGGNSLVELCPSGVFNSDPSDWFLGTWSGSAYKSSALVNRSRIAYCNLQNLVQGRTYYVTINWAVRLYEMDSPASKIVVHLGLATETPVSTLTGSNVQVLDNPGRYEFEIIAAGATQLLNLYAYNVPTSKLGQFVFNEVSVLEII